MRHPPKIGDRVRYAKTFRDRWLCFRDSNEEGVITDIYTESDGAVLYRVQWNNWQSYLVHLANLEVIPAR